MLEILSRYWWTLILRGILAFVFGLAALLWPDITALVLLYLIAAWLVLTGLLEVTVAVLLRRELRGEWLLGLAGVLSVAFGVVLALRPGEGAIALISIIGLFAIVFGAALALRAERALPSRRLTAGKVLLGWGVGGGT